MRLNVVIVKKKDGSNRVAIDYRQLNKKTLFDTEPSVKVADIFAQIGQAKYFSKFDMAKGYWQIPMREEDIVKTAFVTPDGSYEFLRMPFGLMNSGASFTRMMRKLTKGMSGIQHYIDDCLIYSDDWETHLRVVGEFLQRVRAANLTIRPSKCEVGCSQLEFVGHEVKRGEVGLQEANVGKVRDAPRPETKKQVRSFLGLTGYYRDYIPGYAEVAAPLTDLTKKGKPNQVQWDRQCEESYARLRQSLLDRPVLRLPDLGREWTLRVDASDSVGDLG